MAQEDKEVCGGDMESKFSLIEYNRLISRLSLEQIRNLSDQEILDLAIERPGHPGQYGFLLGLEHFRSQEHLAATLHALMERLGKAGVRPRLSD
jgi:hypothetical protein